MIHISGSSRIAITSTILSQVDDVCAVVIQVSVTTTFG
jgi:hypothetical protein